VWDFLVGLLALLIGAVLLFAGYRVALILLPIWGFFVGYFLGLAAIAALFGDGFFSTTLGVIVGFVVGLLFAVLSYLYWYVAVIVLAGSVGASVGAGLMALFGLGPGFLMTLVAIVVAVAFAVGAMVLRIPKLLLIVLSALAGAGAAIAGVLLIFDVIDRQELNTGAVAAVIDESFWWSLVYIVLAAVGITAQTYTTTAFELAVTQSRLGGRPGVAT
jgi:hypothetical protein